MLPCSLCMTRFPEELSGINLLYTPFSGVGNFLAKHCIGAGDLIAPSLIQIRDQNTVAV